MTDSPSPSRRTVLRSAGLIAVGGTGFLAACSAEAETPAPAGKATLAAADVPEGGGVIMPDGAYVVTQPSAGEYKAFNKSCTHQQCPVTRIVGTEINCDCHGSKFSIADGSVLQGPADQPLASATVTVDGDQLTIG